MDLSTFRASASVTIAALPEEIYAFIADMPRMAEISPVSTGGAWESAARGVGALFLGTNRAGDREWQRRIRVATADAPREFAWENLGDPAAATGDGPAAARWGYTFTPVDGGTQVEESWRLLDDPRLEAVGEEQLRQLQVRNEADMATTLANLKRLLES
jgi:hypothetical protein